MPTLRFECKDPLIAAYYEDKFGETFRAELSPQIIRHVQDGYDPLNWAARMRIEAADQEHYDYVLDTNEHGQKIHVLLEPKELLVPTVVIDNA